MIKVQKVDGSDIIINAELIEFVEHHGDTIVSLSTGNKIMLRNSLDDVKDKAIEYKRSIQCAKQSNPEV